MDTPFYQPQEPPKPLTTEKKELIFAVLMALCSLLAVNFTLFGGFNLGFAVVVVLCICLTVGYMLLSHCRPNVYALTVLSLCALIAAGFVRSDDLFVKLVMGMFLFLGITLGFSLLSGKNRFSPNGICSLGDSFSALFVTGLGKLEPALRGLGMALRQSGKLGQGLGAVGLGICIVFPILLVVVPLLISADAAFDGLVALLPAFDMKETIATLFLGAMVFCVLYTLCVGLVRGQQPESAPTRTGKGLSPLTIGTVLGAVCLVYLLYLISQLAYLGGGFSGLLPAEFTLAQYARRGFFEMAALCAINLGIIALCIGVVRKDDTAPLSIRLMCLFLGIVSLFLVISASAKMFLYIESYGLTRLRLLTQIIMLFLSLSTLAVMVWLFVPKLPYMKVILLTALIIGALVIWLDVDNMVAGYNVDAYLSGKLTHIDTDHLLTLGSSAAEHFARLAEESKDPAVIQAAKLALSRYGQVSLDLRSWNWSIAAAQQLINSQ